MALTMSIDFAANVARLVEETKKGSTAVRQMADQVDTAASFIKGALGGIAAGFSVSMFAGQVRAAGEAADAAAKLGDRYGVATQSVVGMSIAMEMAGGTQEGLGNALRNTAISVVEAASKAGEARNAFSQLGLSAAELSRLPLDEQFEKIIGRLSEVENVTQRNALGNQLLGKSYADVAGLVAEGADAIRKAKEDAVAWGLALNDVDVAKVEMANDAMTRVQNAARGLFTTISVTLAPAIKMIADYFADGAKEAKGYKEEVKEGGDLVAKAIAYSVNAVHGINRAWAGVKLAVGLAMDFVIQALASMDQAYTEFMNGFADSKVGQMLGMRKREYTGFLTEMSEISANRVRELREEAFALVEAGWPADKILAKYREVKDQMQREAEEIAARREADRNRNFGSGLSDNKEAVEAAKRELAWQQGVAARLANIQQANMTEEELERGKLTVIQNDLAFALQMRFITQQQHDELLLQEKMKIEAKLGDVEAQGWIARQKFARMSAMQQTQTVLGQMVAMTQGVATHSQAMFEINKMASLANSAVRLPSAVIAAYETYGGGPIGIAMGALTLAAGLAQIDAINSAQFGSSTSAPSVGGGGAVPVTPVGSAASLPVNAAALIEAPRRDINITVNGSRDLYGHVVEDLVPELVKAMDNGAFDVRINYAR